MDLVIAETMDQLEEALLAVEVITSFGLPAVVTMATPRMGLRGGHTVLEAMRALRVPLPSVPVLPHPLSSACCSPCSSSCPALSLSPSLPPSLSR